MPIKFIWLKIADLAAMLHGDILIINWPSAAYISIGKVVLRMRSKVLIGWNETACKWAGGRH